MNICPRCKSKIVGFPATSRLDNETEICSNCGSEEAIFDFSISKLNYKDKVTKKVKQGLWLTPDKYMEYLTKIFETDDWKQWEHEKNGKPT